MEMTEVRISLVGTHFLRFVFLFSHSREGEKGKGREMGGERERERDRLVASCMHSDWGSNQQPRHVP